VLIVHGTEDVVVPVEHGRRLFEAAREPKRLAVMQGAGHSGLWDAGLWPIVLDFLDANSAAGQPQAWVRRIPSFAG
jgi:pimeloyl-ACP methyl ester carboxylesterase